MKKFQILLAILLIHFIPVNGISQFFQWAEGSELEAGTETSTVDLLGNFYKVGVYNGTADLDPGPDELSPPLEPGSSESAYIIKLNPDGELVWAKILNQGESEAYAVETDASGNVYLFGKYHESIDVDPGPDEVLLPYSFDGKCFIVKLDVEGNYVWERHIDGEDEEVYATPGSLTINKLGHVLMTGSYSNGLLDANPNPDETVYIPSYTHSASKFLIKLDTAGTFIWGDYISAVYDADAPPDPPTIVDVAMDDDGRTFICGRYIDQSDFNPGAGDYYLTPTYGVVNNYILCLGPLGEFEWVRSCAAPEGSEGTIIITGITVNKFGDVYTTGHFNQALDFDLGGPVTIIAPLEGYDQFILSMDADVGDFNWVKVIGGTGNERAYDIEVDKSSSQLLITGSSDTPMLDLDPSAAVFEVTTEGDQDIIITALDFSGNFNWGLAIGGSEMDKGCFIGSDILQNVYISGVYNDLVDFNFEIAESILDADELGNLFFMMLNYTCEGDAVYTDMAVTACNLFRVPSGDEVYYESGTYMDTINSYFGCADSIITIDLTIIPVDASITQVESTLFADMDDITYQWVNCEDDYTAIDGATDQSFTPITDGVYALIATNGECTDTSDCFSFLHFSIDESKQISFSVYPNPTKGDVQIEFNQPVDKLMLRVYAVSGQLIFEKQLLNQTHVNLPFALANGLYLLELEQGNGKIDRVKIIRQ